jgi:hypothetical protein
MNITPDKLAKALLISRHKHDMFRNRKVEVFEDMPHWKMVDRIEEAKIIIEALKIIKENKLA